MKISAYTTTLNCADMDYPFLECLEGLFSFADEVCVADGGSTDTTIEQITKRFPQVIVESYPVDMDHPRWAIYSDGYLKTKARNLCTGDVLWQSDNDEIINSTYVDIARKLCEVSYKNSLNLSVPLLEFWGSVKHLRRGIPPKPRITPNHKNIIHGIPSHAKAFDSQGHEYCKPYLSDSCDYIDKMKGNPLSFTIAKSQPLYVWHLSWLDLQRKILHYKRHWCSFHNSMYNLNRQDTSENNVMFNKPWSDVSEEDVGAMAEKLENYGPRFFHSKQEEWEGEVYELNNLDMVPPSVLKWASARGIE